MRYILAYVGTILIWSTTPLAIKWSGEGLHFLSAVAARMVLGMIICLLLVIIFRKPFPWHAAARNTYLAAGLGIFGAMLCVYYSAQFIPSGLVSVIFGIAPLLSSVAAAIWLGERSLGWQRVMGLVLGLLGLLVIFRDSLVLDEHVNPNYLEGVLGILLAACLQVGSAVVIKRISVELPALSITAGGLAVASFFFTLTWYVFHGYAAGMALPEPIPWRAVGSTIYLGILGSVIGFMLYYYLIQNIGVSKTAYITLVTPVTALILGTVLNQESITMGIGLGAFCILTGQALHHAPPIRWKI